METKKVNELGGAIIKEIVDIHLATFKGFFLTFLGQGFLCQMYESYILHDKSDILVAVEKDRVVGFLAYSSDLSGLYKNMIKKRLLKFMWYSLGAFFRNPKVFARLIRAFLKPGEAKRSERYIELTSIGVHPNKKAKGIGSKLIDTLKKSTDFDTYAYITLDTDAIDNDAVNRFYQKNGFILFREFETHEGRKMNEYRMYDMGEGRQYR